MSTTKQETRRAAKPQQDSPWPQVRLSETDRLETFSDSVLSITITLLVAEIVQSYGRNMRRPAVGEADRAMGRLHRVPCVILIGWSYLAQSSRVFARVRYCDRSLHLANLFLLLTSALIPLPTAILSAAIQRGNEFDARVAVTLYAAIAASMCLALVSSKSAFVSSNKQICEPHGC
jgi:uncharacterized membrane protein